MLRYNKSFPLKKGLRFSSFMKRLDELSFSPYTLLIEKTDKPDIYNIEVILNDVLSGFHPFVPEGVLLNICTIQYNKDKRVFTISASMSNGSLLAPLLYLIISISFLLFFVFVTIIKHLPLENILIGLIIAVITLFPFIATYTNERKLLNRIGALGVE